MNLDGRDLHSHCASGATSQCTGPSRNQLMTDFRPHSLRGKGERGREAQPRDQRPANMNGSLYYGLILSKIFARNSNIYRIEFVFLWSALLCCATVLWFSMPTHPATHQYAELIESETHWEWDSSVSCIKLIEQQTRRLNGLQIVHGKHRTRSLSNYRVDSTMCRVYTNYYGSLELNPEKWAESALMADYRWKVMLNSLSFTFALFNSL